MKTITLNDILSTGLSQNTTITTADIIICLLITFIIALLIYYIYKKTYSGVLYSQEFNVTLIIVSMVVAVIMLSISRNLALSLGMVGALSIVRFRSAIKDPRDITFIFWSISVGIVNGVQFYKLSIVSSILIGLVLVLMSKRIRITQPYLLVMNYSSLDDAKLEQIINKYCRKFRIRNSTLTEESNEKVIELKIKKSSENKLLNELRLLKGIKKINFFSYNGELRD